MYFVMSRAVASGTVVCTFVRADARLDFSRDLVSLWTKTCQLEEQLRRLREISSLRLSRPSTL